MLMVGCAEKNDPKPDPGPSNSLNGYWDRGDIVVQISGSTGTFFQINSGYWKNALDLGFISIGSQKFRYLTQVKDGTWAGQELWNFHNSGGTVTEVRWSETGEFILSSNGNTLTVTTKDPWEDDFETSEYTRVNP